MQQEPAPSPPSWARLVTAQLEHTCYSLLVMLNPAKSSPTTTSTTPDPPTPYSTTTPTGLLESTRLSAHEDPDIASSNSMSILQQPQQPPPPPPPPQQQAPGPDAAASPHQGLIRSPCPTLLSALADHQPQSSQQDQDLLSAFAASLTTSAHHLSQMQLLQQQQHHQQLLHQHLLQQQHQLQQQMQQAAPIPIQPNSMQRGASLPTASRLASSVSSHTHGMLMAGLSSSVGESSILQSSLRHAVSCSPSTGLLAQHCSLSSAVAEESLLAQQAAAAAAAAVASAARGGPGPGRGGLSNAVGGPPLVYGPSPSMPAPCTLPSFGSPPTHHRPSLSTLPPPGWGQAQHASHAQHAQRAVPNTLGALNIQFASASAIEARARELIESSSRSKPLGARGNKGQQAPHGGALEGLEGRVQGEPDSERALQLLRYK